MIGFKQTSVSETTENSFYFNFFFKKKKSLSKYEGDFSFLQLLALL